MQKHYHFHFQKCASAFVTCNNHYVCKTQEMILCLKYVRIEEQCELIQIVDLCFICQRVIFLMIYETMLLLESPKIYFFRNCSVYVDAYKNVL